MAGEETMIANLQGQIERLQSENATLRTEAKDRRIKARALKEENDKFAKSIQDLTAERDSLKAQAEAEPGAQQREIERLTGIIRERTHRDKFNALAREERVTADRALDDLWTASGYKAESDEVDESRLKAAIGKALEGRDYLRAAPAPDGANGKAAGAATTPAHAPRAVHESREAGPGASRGAASTTTSDVDAALAAKYPSASRLA